MPRTKLSKSVVFFEFLDEAGALLLSRACGEHERSRGVYGSPRIHAQLCKRQIHVNVKTVAHIMNDANIRAKTVKKWHPRTTQSNHTIAPVANIIERNLPRVAPTKNGCATSLTSQPKKDFYISLVLMDVWSRSHWDSHGMEHGQHAACDDCDRRADDGCEAQVSTDWSCSSQ
jgi:transposase InsO family protein